MRPSYILLMATAMNLLPVTSFAEDRYDCITKCSAEKSIRDSACPWSSELDTNSSSSRRNSRCMQKSDSAYSLCFNRCPPPQFAPAPSSANKGK